MTIYGDQFQGQSEVEWQPGLAEQESNATVHRETIYGPSAAACSRGRVFAVSCRQPSPDGAVTEAAHVVVIGDGLVGKNRTSTAREDAQRFSVCSEHTGGIFDIHAEAQKDSLASSTFLRFTIFFLITSIRVDADASERLSPLAAVVWLAGSRRGRLIAHVLLWPTSMTAAM